MLGPHFTVEESETPETRALGSAVRTPPSSPVGDASALSSCLQHRRPPKTKLFFRSSIVFLKKDFIYLFSERGEEREKDGEKHQCVVASYAPTTQACALTGN